MLRARFQIRRRGGEGATRPAEGMDDLDDVVVDDDDDDEQVERVTYVDEQRAGRLAKWAASGTTKGTSTANAHGGTSRVPSSRAVPVRPLPPSAADFAHQRLWGSDDDEEDDVGNARSSLEGGEGDDRADVAGGGAKPRDDVGLGDASLRGDEQGAVGDTRRHGQGAACTSQVPPLNLDDGMDFLVGGGASSTLD